MSWTYQYGQELGEKLLNDSYKVEVSDLTSMRESDSNKAVIKALVQEGIEAIPEDETLKQVEVLLRTFETPAVRVWCNSKDFNYENSRCESGSTYVKSTCNTYRYSIDVRPF